MLQGFLGLLLIVPETGLGYLVFEPLQLGALGIYVKETSAIRRRPVSNPRTCLAIPELQECQALSVLLQILCFFSR